MEHSYLAVSQVSDMFRIHKATVVIKCAAGANQEIKYNGLTIKKIWKH